MRFDIVTIFPRMFDSPLAESIIKRAGEKGLVKFRLHDIRDFATDKHKCVDDTPYGGGAGMVMMPGPITRAVEQVPREGKSLRILLTPEGEPFSQRLARELAGFDQLILICGRYEGIDERARHLIAEREISIGDYIVGGGEIPAMVVIDAVVRLLPGALGNQESAQQESFEEGLLEYPQYTRPETFQGQRVPEVLLSGNHAKIARWRRKQMLKKTQKRRPDLLKRVRLSEEDRRLLEEE
jgi:tRNA (guanine37-N1)-methyltransferase